MASARSAFSDNLALSGDPGSSPNEFISLTSGLGIESLVITGDPAGGSFTLDDFTYDTGPISTGPSSMPEPSSLSLFATMCVGLFFYFRVSRPFGSARFPEASSKLRAD